MYAYSFQFLTYYFKIKEAGVLFYIICNGNENPGRIHPIVCVCVCVCVCVTLWRGGDGVAIGIVDGGGGNRDCWRRVGVGELAITE